MWSAIPAADYLLYAEQALELSVINSDKPAQLIYTYNIRFELGFVNGLFGFIWLFYSFLGLRG